MITDALPAPLHHRTTPHADSADAAVQQTGMHKKSALKAHAGKTDTLGRLGRIQVQVRGISRMVAEDRYCIDILTQVSAVEHMERCRLGAARVGGPDEQEKLKEASDAIARLVRS